MELNNFIKIVKPFTMTPEERIVDLFHSLEYIRLNNIEGDFVECGVWKGGNILGILEYLTFYNMTNNNVWLYDTFEGMTTPEDIDIDYMGEKYDNNNTETLCYSSIDEVKNNIQSTKYPMDKIKFIKGDICETLNFKVNRPQKISLLRLDTDWYKSTKKELEILYPLLSDKGVLIVDDYNHWQGCKEAVNEYFKNIGANLKFEEVDYSSIKVIK